MVHRFNELYCAHLSGMTKIRGRKAEPVSGSHQTRKVIACFTLQFGRVSKTVDESGVCGSTIAKETRLVNILHVRQ